MSIAELIIVLGCICIAAWQLFMPDPAVISVTALVLFCTVFFRPVWQEIQKAGRIGKKEEEEEEEKEEDNNNA